MNERVKKRVAPILLTVMLSLFVAIAAVGIVGVDYAQAATRVSASAGAGGEGMDEDVHTSATYDFASVTTSNSSGQKYVDLSYIGNYHTVTLKAGSQYIFEVWGAQGGTAVAAGGKGGYATGKTKQLTSDIVVYVYVGGQGQGHRSGCQATGGWNGGGYGYSTSSSNAKAGGGGGTDIRTKVGNYNSRVIVAGGGGGGASSEYSSNKYGGVGGGASGGSGAYYSGNPNNNNDTRNPGGGTQSGIGNRGTTNGGATSSSPGFGYGGNALTSHSYGCPGGGGGWYGGWGSNAGHSGAGGSGYVMTSSSYKPSGYLGANTSSELYTAFGWLETTSLLDGLQSIPVTTINSTAKETGHAGNGFARITQLNSIPAQRSKPTVTLGKNVVTQVNVREGVTSGTNGVSLNGYDGDYSSKGELVAIKTKALYLSASTASPATEWLDYTFDTAANGTYFTVKAKKWWSSSKKFYVQVKDIKGSADVGGSAWFEFSATVDTPTLSALNKPATTQLVQGMNYRFGAGNTTDPKLAEESGKIYNPLGGNRQTLWLKDPLSTANAVSFDVSTLYSLANHNKAQAGDNTLMYVNSVSYTANRYDKDSGAVQAISANVSGASNSAYFTDATLNTNVTAGSVSGRKTLVLKGKPVPAGPYYYVITIRMQRACAGGGGVIDSQEFDVVYRVDNTRPKLSATKDMAAFTVRAGETITIDLADFCIDEDRNDLTIKDVVVPEGEFVAVDQYGNILTSSSKYPTYANFNYGLNGSGVLTDAMLGGGSGSANKVIKETAQHPTVKTGFDTSSVYYMDGMSNGLSKSAFGGTQAQGNAQNAYIGYYLNTAATGAAAKTQIWITGNKASRSQYATDRVSANAAEAMGHFYILVNIADAGDRDDLGIWLPVCITVTSAAPTLNVTNDGGASVYPSVDGNRGDSVIFTPVGGYASAEANAALNPIGSLTQNGANNTFNSALKLLAYDRDIFSSTSGSDPRNVSVRLPGASADTTVKIAAPASSLGAMSAQRDIVFLRKNGSTVNDKLTSALTGNAWDNRGIDDGFKEFYTVTFVELYASTSILYDLPVTTIQSLVSDGVITFVQKEGGGEWLVQYYGLQVTLKKHTMGKYVNCNVEVTDTFGVTSTLRLAVRVADTAFGSASARVTESMPDRMKFNTRPNANYPNGSASKGANLTFNFRIKINEANKSTEDLYISPYDLFYDPDTYTVNSYTKTQGNETVTVTEDGKYFNTVPNTDGYANVLAGTQKKIAVAVSDTPSSDLTRVEDFAMERLTVNENSKTPTVVGGGVYATVRYHEETQSFRVVPIGKTPKSIPVSFTMTIYSSATQSTVSATINVYVENSLPSKRIEDDKVFYLSATPTLGNSSVAEGVASDDRGTALNGNRYYTINNETYNVREFALDDLFLDRDGDSIRYGVGNVIEVGTKDVHGNFISFIDKDGVDHNTFIRAYIGAGSNQRAGTNNCLIIEGLSSTQGVPGGVWIRFDVTDNALDTTADDKVSYMFQVEVINSVPTYADMTGNNAMEEVTDGEGYHWVTESEITSVVGAMAFAEFAEGEERKILAPNGVAVTTVNKALYIVSDDSVMEMYKEYVTQQKVPFSYSAQQVRRIAADADNTQGLALFGGGNTGLSTDAEPDVKFVDEISQDFSPTSTAETGKFNSQNPAVIVNTFYNGKGANDIYYKRNAIVKLVFFDDAKNRITGNAANNATHWVIAFNFTDTPSEDVDVRIRLRDANNNVSYVGTVGKGDSAEDATVTYTTGGYSVLPDPKPNNSAYRGVRELSADKTAFVPNTNISALYGATEDSDGTGVFAVKISKQAQNLYNNFTKWGTTATKTYNGKTYSLNNVWAYDMGEDGWRTYEDISAGYLDNRSAFFAYDKINVTRTGSVAVPISYFAWPSEVTAESHRFDGQGQFAWFDVDNFPLILRSGDIPQANPQIVGGASVLANIADAITLSDGVTTWTGNNLNTNPYITFQGIGTVNDPTADFAGSTYLHDQRRFSIAGDVTNDISPQGTGIYADKYFFEDTFGLKMTKKSIRSVGELTLSVRLAVWKGANAISSSATTLPTKAKDDKGNTMTITVNVPVTVENTYISMQDTFADVSLTAANRSGKQISLTTSATGNTEDNTQYLKGNNPPSGTPIDQVVDGEKRPYAEDIYYAMSSLTTITEQQLNHIKANYPAWSYTDSRLRDYFGLTQNSDILNLSIADGKLMYNGTTEVVANPYYSNYFTVSPTNVDGNRITITPLRMTTFDYAHVEPLSGESKKEAIEREAKERGLAVKWKSDNTTVDYIYYPLKLIVYDRLTVGLETNSTSFTDASIDVVTINVRIGNSKPTALTRNLGKDGVTMDGTKYAGRQLSLSKGASATYAFTDLIEDLDMVVDTTTRSYRIEDYFTQDSTPQLQKDTGDYLHKWSGEGDARQFVKIEVLDKTGKNSLSTDQLTCKQSDATSALDVTITLNDIQGLTIGGRIGYVRLTFADSYYNQDDSSKVQIVFEVLMSNAASTYTQNSQNVRRVTMHSNDYFTLYTTPYDQFKQGAGTATVGSLDLNGKPTGNNLGKFVAPENEPGSNKTWRGSRKLTGNIQPWSYYDGVYLGTNSNGNAVYSGKLDEDWEIQGVQEDGTTKVYPVDYTGIASDLQWKGTGNNLGYMPIATDDAPWTLRISKAELTGTGSNMLELIRINETAYEGSDVKAPMAVMIVAYGACEDVTLTVTLTDGISGEGSNAPYSLTYTMSITVVSTLPVAKNADNKDYGLKWNIEGQDGYYSLSMHKGEELELPLNAFVSDADRGDEQKLYIFPQSGNSNNLFEVRNYDEYKDKTFAFGTKYTTVTPIRDSNTQRAKSFTVSASNFHSMQESDAYDEYTFKISDPYYSDESKTCTIVLRVYVVPSGVTAVAQPPVPSVILNGVQEATSEKGPSVIDIVTKENEGGLFEDGDVGAQFTAYTVRVYSYAAKNADGKLTVAAFNALTDKSAQLVAEFIPNIDPVNGVTSSTSLWSGANAQVLQDYIANIAFSSDGSKMTVYPKRSTYKHSTIPDSKDQGMGLYIEVEKNVGQRQTTGMKASARLNASIKNSAPKAVGETPANYGKQRKNGELLNNGREFLHLEGVRGDSWTYYYANPYSEDDEALFVDPDGQDIVAGATAQLYNMFVYDVDPESGARTPNYMGIGDEGQNKKSFDEVWKLAEKAFDMTRDMKVDYTYETGSGENAETHTEKLNGMAIAIASKIDLSVDNRLAQYKDRTVYLTIRIFGKDEVGIEQTTDIVLGIANSTPSFKPQTGENAINQKYNDPTKYTSYEGGADADAFLTLTLNQDPDSRFLGNKGVLSVPLSDLINDADYTSGKNTETFTLVHADGNEGSVTSDKDDFALLSGHPDRTLYATKSAFVTSSDGKAPSGTLFTARVSDTYNTAIVFQVHSYERGASVQLRLVVADSSGAKTRTLTVTLVVGNSAPVDLTGDNPELAQIVLAGGQKPPQGNAFPSKTYSILDFVSDVNEGKTGIPSVEQEPAWYLRISNFSWQSADWLGSPSVDVGGDGSGSSSGGSSSGGSGSGEVDLSTLMLVNFSQEDEQHFSISPIAGRYGSQEFHITISDGGNKNASDDRSITIILTVQITKNPNDVDVVAFNVHWKQEKAVTIDDIYANNEGDGFMVVGLTIPADKRNIAEVRHVEGSSVWSVFGNTRNQEVDATVIIAVGSMYDPADPPKETYPRALKIIVGDNNKPTFNLNHNGKEYSNKEVTYITKGMYDDDGMWELDINNLLIDAEGDVLQLLSASSDKKALITVSADTQNNKLVFHFKSRGTATIKVKVSDAVGPYTYSFKIGTNDRPEPNFFVGIIARVQSNPLIFLVIGAAFLLLLIILIIIIAAVRKKKKMRAEIEALLVSEMELEEQMLKLAAGPSPTSYQAYGYLPPNPAAGQTNPNMMLGSGQSAPDQNAAIGLNPGAGNTPGAVPNTGNGNTAPQPPRNDFNDDDL